MSYKLYKSGKVLVTALVVLGVAYSSVGARADETAGQNIVDSSVVVETETASKESDASEQVEASTDVSNVDTAETVVAEKNGFISENGKLFYYVNGVKQTGWHTKNNKNDWYYFGADGAALTGLQYLDGGYKYFDASYVQVKNAWRTTGGNRWYFLSSYDGKAYTGLQQMDGGYKFFDNNGIQAKGAWRTTGGNRWYYLSGYDGKAYTGLQQIDGGYKYFDNNGQQAKDARRTTGGNRWYFLDAYDGHALTGLHYMEGTAKFFDGNGIQVKNAWRTTGNNKWYHFDANTGAAARGWFLDGTAVKFFNDDFTQNKGGWAEDRGEWYYTDPYDGHIESGNDFVENVIRSGESLVGRSPYVWGGGRTASSIAKRQFDCSSFVHWMFANAGLNIEPVAHTTTYTQRYIGPGVDYNRMRRGDVFFMDNFGHVGVYIGGGFFIHDSPSSPTGGVGVNCLFDEIDRDGQKVSWNTLSDYWARRYW